MSIKTRIAVSVALLCGAIGATNIKAAVVEKQSTCFVMGDSIAQGIALNLPQCQSNTKVGLNTTQAIKRFENIPHADLTIISLGINDSFNGTSINLGAIRGRISSSKVIWILPSHQDKKDAVELVAKVRGDKTINVDRHISKDGIHPTWHGYKSIATSLMNIGESV